MAVGIALISAVRAQVPATGDAASPSDRYETRPSRVRNALRKAQDFYRKGEYEVASTYFQQAQAGQEELTPPELQELSNWFQLNNTALQALRAGAMRLLGHPSTLQFDALPRDVDIRVKRAEGFAYYAVYPQLYALATRALWPGRRRRG